MIDRKPGNGFTLFGAELGELAAAAQEEQAVDARSNQIVDQRGGTRFIELAIGGKMVETGGMIPVNNADCGMRSPC